MWSPRKDHAVVELNGRLILMGGRAREHANLPSDTMAGGLFQYPTQEDPFFFHWREVLPMPPPHLDGLSLNNHIKVFSCCWSPISLVN